MQEADASGGDVRVELGEEGGLGLRGLLLGGAILFWRGRAVLLGRLGLARGRVGVGVGGLGVLEGGLGGEELGRVDDGGGGGRERVLLVGAGGVRGAGRVGGLGREVCRQGGGGVRDEGHEAEREERRTSLGRRRGWENRATEERNTFRAASGRAFGLGWDEQKRKPREGRGQSPRARAVDLESPTDRRRPVIIQSRGLRGRASHRTLE